MSQARAGEVPNRTQAPVVVSFPTQPARVRSWRAFPLMRATGRLATLSGDT